MNNHFFWFLRILVIVQSLGYAAKLVAPSALNSFLLGSMGDPFLTHMDRSVQVFLWFSSAALLGLGFLQPPPGSILRKVDFTLLGIVAIWAFVLAIFSWWVNPGNAFHATDPIGHAVRFAAPLALILFLAFPGQQRESKIEWALRLGVAGTFIGHGLCALWMKPSFIDLIVGNLNLLLGDPVLTAESSEALQEALSIAASRQAFAEAALPVIAIQDFILVAFLLLPGKRIKTIALWMAVWGFVTAMSRVTVYGWDYWHDLALRICNGGIPFFLWAYWKAQDSSKLHNEN